MENKKWSEGAWEAAKSAYEAILKLPFLAELADGSLSSERINEYITQDNLYLDDYSRVLAHIASRLDDLEDVDAFVHFASEGVAMEKGMHALYPSDPEAMKSPVCRLYSSFLKSQAYESVAVETASVLPCFWVYQQVGNHILRTAILDGNPYAPWIEAYSNEAFDLSTSRAIAICDKLASSSSEEIRQKMTEVFVRATEMEWMFWDSAYRMAQWPKF